MPAHCRSSWLLTPTVDVRGRTPRTAQAPCAGLGLCIRGERILPSAPLNSVANSAGKAPIIVDEIQKGMPECRAGSAGRLRPVGSEQRGAEIFASVVRRVYLTTRGNLMIEQQKLGIFRCFPGQVKCILAFPFKRGSLKRIKATANRAHFMEQTLQIKLWFATHACDVVLLEI